MARTNSLASRSVLRMTCPCRFLLLCSLSVLWTHVLRMFSCCRLQQAIHALRAIPMPARENMRIYLYPSHHAFATSSAKRYSPNRASSNDANDIPESKRRAAELNSKIASNLSRKEVVDYNALQELIRDMEVESSQNGFWENQGKAQQLLAELNRAKSMVRRVDDWKKYSEDIAFLFDMINDDPAEADAYVQEIKASLGHLEKDLDEFEIQRLLNGKYDMNACMLCIKVGAGGTEAEDWAGMLYRMYKRFAESRHMKITILDEVVADHGFKSIEMKLEGPYAYGYLSGEKGTHRLVRISPFNAQGKRQTTFASVETWPVLEDNDIVDIEIPEKDLEISTMRSGGAGGQNVNKVESAVRIKHIPSGLAVRCSQERSQPLNKALALKSLKEKLLSIAQEQALADFNEIKGEMVDATFGQQIRNYVMAPYKLVKDTRTGHETPQVQDVLDGDLDAFINSFLRSGRKKSDGSFALPLDS